MKRYSFSFLLMLLPGLLSAAALTSVSGELAWTGYGPSFTGLQGVYDTAAKTLTITNFVGTEGQVYGATDQYALVFNGVENGGTCTAEASQADATYYYSSGSKNKQPFTATATVEGNTIVIKNAGGTGTTFYIHNGTGTLAPGTTNVPNYSFTFTFDGDLDDVTGDLTLDASLSNITSNAAQLSYNLSWTGGQAPANLEDYTVTVTGDNNFQTATASGPNTNGVIDLTNLEYATPYIFNVTASVTADGQTYTSKSVTLQLVPVLESGLTLDITAPETTTSTEVDIDYSLTFGNLTEGTQVYVNIAGDNGFETLSMPVTSATGSITLTDLEPGITYSFIAQSSANVGAGNYLFSPAKRFTVTTDEGANPLNIEDAEVESEETSATITGTVTSELDPSTPVKVYYILQVSE